MPKLFRLLTLSALLFGAVSIAAPDLAQAEDDDTNRRRRWWKKWRKRKNRKVPEVDPRHAGALVITIAGGAYLILRNRKAQLPS